MHEVLHVVVPTHLLTSYIPPGLTTGFSLAATGCQFTVAQHILTDIFEEEGELSRMLRNSSWRARYRC